MGSLRREALARLADATMGVDVEHYVAEPCAHPR